MSLFFISRTVTPSHLLYFLLFIGYPLTQNGTTTQSRDVHVFHSELYLQNLEQCLLIVGIQYIFIE